MLPATSASVTVCGMPPEIRLRKTTEIYRPTETSAGGSPEVFTSAFSPSAGCQLILIQPTKVYPSSASVVAYDGVINYLGCETSWCQASQASTRRRSEIVSAGESLDREILVASPCGTSSPAASTPPTSTSTAGSSIASSLAASFPWCPASLGQKCFGWKKPRLQDPCDISLWRQTFLGHENFGRRSLGRERPCHSSTSHESCSE